MTPDKLPKEIADKIKSDASAYSDISRFIAYTQGATAWAPWKVKYDELQEQAQRMADALEWIKTYGPADDLTVKFVNKALQQFKDGKGKESPKEIEYMPIHPDDARKFDCPTQFPMHLLSESQALSNHGQSLQRLKERGGLSVREILAIVGRKKWSYYGNLGWEEAIKMLNDIIITNPTK